MLRQAWDPLCYLPLVQKCNVFLFCFFKNHALFVPRAILHRPTRNEQSIIEDVVCCSSCCIYARNRSIEGELGWERGKGELGWERGKNDRRRKRRVHWKQSKYSKRR